MAKNSAIPVDKSWEAENDARAIMDCMKIMKDPKRKEAAMKAMEKMQKEHTDNVEAMDEILGGKDPMEE